MALKRKVQRYIILLPPPKKLREAQNIICIPNTKKKTSLHFESFLFGGLQDFLVVTTNFKILFLLVDPN